GVPEVAGDVTFTVFVGDPITREFTLSVNAPAETTDPPGEPTDPTPAPTEPSEPTEPPEPVQPDGTQPGPVDAGGPGQGLPGTGINGVATLATIAALVLLTGTALLVVRQRRHHNACTP